MKGRFWIAPDPWLLVTSNNLLPRSPRAKHHRGPLWLLGKKYRSKRKRLASCLVDSYDYESPFPDQFRLQVLWRHKNINTGIKRIKPSFPLTSCLFCMYSLIGHCLHFSMLQADDFPRVAYWVRHGLNDTLIGVFHPYNDHAMWLQQGDRNMTAASFLHNGDAISMIGLCLSFAMAVVQDMVVIFQWSRAHLLQ